MGEVAVFRLALAFGLFLAPVFASRALAQGSYPTAAPLLACTADQISLGTDSENGAFDGMNQSGTLLVLRNVSPTACKIEPVPRIGFLDASNVKLDIAIERDSPFVHPSADRARMPLGHGPVLLPIALDAGAEATTTLHWVAGEVYDHSVCVTTAFVNVDVAGELARTTLRAHVCAPDATQLHVRAKRLALDPTYTP